jgi:beta-ribofuranosylaminobenzene 5'-phosphate synthase
MSPIVQITAPSRLHFGLWSLGGAGARQFGGVGAMVEQPALRLCATEAASFSTAGECADLAAEYARRWSAFHRLEIPNCHLTIEQAIPKHAGLGSGTQLALSVAAALNAFAGLPSQTPPELALSVGRGLRSAVGTYGFVFGGLIVEQGKLADEPISPLDCRIDLPEEWRFVLLRPRGPAGLAGREETEAFAALAAVPPEVTNQLVAETRDRLVPAAAMADFPAFSQSLYHYGRMSGEIFAARQGGPYNGPVIADLVEKIRGRGFEGAGQSSWGPTVFAVTPSESAAKTLVEELRHGASAELEAIVTASANQGARIEARGIAAAEPVLTD